jgi:septation ring formation regulator EzrA
MIDLIEMESEAQTKVNKSITSIEIAMARWDNAKEKPPHLKERINDLKISHKLFSEWQKKSLKGQKDLPSVIARLNEFGNICNYLKKKGL